MTDSNTAPPTPGTTTPAAKRYKLDADRLSDISTTPTAPKPTRLEFTLPRPNNKRNDRLYKTPTKSTNDGKRATKPDDRTPVQIKAMKKTQQSQPMPEQTAIPRKSKKKATKKTSKSIDKKEAKKKSKTKRGGKKKHHQLRAHKYGNKATP